MVCKFCGNTIEDNSEFCFICGNKVIKDEIPAEAVYAQPAPVEIPVVAAEAPAADSQIVYQQAPVYAQPGATVYAQQAYIQQIAEPKKARKEKQAKSSCSKAMKFFAALFAATFVLQFIPWIWYKNAKKAGYEEKATSILNSTMVGLCIFMAIISVLLIKKFML
jgi:uncharacterized membrane protein YcjF (UPF0283 family)